MEEPPPDETCGVEGGAGSDVSPIDVVRCFAERRLTFLLVIYLIEIDN